MQQTVKAFVLECEVLDNLYSKLNEEDWKRPTQFKQWTPEDILVHLHFWNTAADLSLQQPAQFARLFAEVAASTKTEGMRPIENRKVSERGTELLEVWRGTYQQMSAVWSALDPKTRVKWAGPDMSVRSSITARQMETWAHGQAVFDLCGQQRQETDRLKNIVVLGVNTYEWTYKVRKLTLPGPMPQLILTSPDGEQWTFGNNRETDTDTDTQHDELIKGSAVGFAQTVTQTRNAADTDLIITGPVATDWMSKAQCFAGDAVAPPVAGTRFMETTGIVVDSPR